MKTRTINILQCHGKGILALLTASFLFLFFTSYPAFSSMDPSEIKKINEKAPYHVIGLVTEDQFVKQLSESKDAPVQLRKMKVEMIEIDRVPRDKPLTFVEVYYSFVPSWVVRDGGKGMDIAEGDIIEIWLEDAEYGLEPAASGDSVNHLLYVENRPEHIPEPFHSKASHFGRSFLSRPHTIGNVVVLSGFTALSLLLATIGIRRMKHSN